MLNTQSKGRPPYTQEQVAQRTVNLVRERMALVLLGGGMPVTRTFADEVRNCASIAEAQLAADYSPPVEKVK